ncbi:hypothetical protein K8I61_18350 [bacterium]|nr:hypothetical protein [bacterium]
MKIRAVASDVTQIETDALVVSFFEDERPLKGHTGMADWRLCGLLSGYIIARRIDGHLGEAILFPMNHRMKVRMVLALGLGTSDRFDDRTFTDVCRRLADAMFKLEIHDFALALPGSILDGFDAAAACARLCEEIGDRYRRDRDMMRLLNVQILGIGPILKEMNPIVAKYEHRFNEELRS